MLRDELRVRFSEGAAGILPLVPLDSAHVGEELLHRALVSGEELSIQEARIPAEKDPADIEHDDAPLIGIAVTSMRCHWSSS